MERPIELISTNSKTLISNSSDFLSYPFIKFLMSSI